MRGLSIEHIEIISKEVASAGITFSHLQEELIDHLCCEIEKEMLIGFSFEEASAKLFRSIGSRGLRKVQENTLLLIDKNYRIMKRMMRITGLIAMPLLAFGAIFKIMHWPGAGILLTLGFVILSFFFLPSALFVMRKEARMKGRNVIYILALISGIALFLGILFKIQHWPGAGILLLCGFLGISLGLIPALLISKLRDESEKKLHSTYILGAISIAIYFLGELFKMMHYPGAGVLLMAGAILLTTVFLPVYAYKVYRATSYIKGSFIYLCIGIFFLNLFNILLALNVSRDVLSYNLKPGGDLILTTKIIEKQNQSLLTLIKSDSLSGDTDFMKRSIKISMMADEFCSDMEKIKVQLIVMTDGCSETEASVKAKSPEQIIAKDNYDVPTHLLCGRDPDFSTGKARLIKMKMEAYKDSLLKYCDHSENTKMIISKTLSTTFTADPSEPAVTWELHHFYHIVLIAAINKLSYFQRNVRLAESQALQYFAFKSTGIDN
jgi:hypothetical protein